MYKEYFKIHQVAGRIENITLIEYPEKILLLDTGSKKDYKLLVKFISDHLKRDMSDVSLVAVSHIHPDHSGGAFALRKKYNCLIAGHPDLDKWYRGISGRMQQVADVFFSHFTATQASVPARRFWFKRKVMPDYKLSDGDPLPFFEDWTAYHTPGHTTNDIVFYHAASRTLYVSDLIVKINDKFHMPYGIPLPELMEESLKKISSFDVEILILPHGGVESISNIKEIVNPLFKEFNMRPGFPVNLIGPFTRLSPEIRKHKKLNRIVNE